MHTTLRTAIVAITAALLLATGTPTATARPSIKEVCTGDARPPAGSLMAAVCQTIGTHPEGPCGERPWGAGTAEPWATASLAEPWAAKACSGDGRHGYRCGRPPRRLSGGQAHHRPCAGCTDHPRAA